MDPEGHAPGGERETAGLGIAAHAGLFGFLVSLEQRTRLLERWTLAPTDGVAPRRNQSSDKGPLSRGTSIAPTGVSIIS